ncbi:MAG: HAMP domain-containing protein [Acidimicrobiia bacterium]|nr:HAMP domain-containing protein [Acidimicrobiia bacterium]NNF11277.1 HAMP domain-containing protein [Acidimicrobiia bacterium]
MRRRRPDEWWEVRGEWWDHPGRGAEAWQGFGRHMFFGALVFFFLFVLFIGALVALVISAVSDLGGWRAGLVVLAAPFAVMLVASVLGRSFVRSWRPVRRLIRAAGALADGDYTARVEPTGSRSMRSVVASFNDMATRLESADEQRRRLLADLSHELRTPLTVVRGEIEAMLDGVHEPSPDELAALIGEVEIMERLLDDLRTLSLLEAGALDLHPEPTDLGALIDDVADAHRRRAAELGVLVEGAVDPGLPEVVVDPVRIREVLSNLAVNALRAMPEGGVLTLGGARHERSVTLTVADTGTGIEPEELGRVFDRFHKGSTSRGSGLGLTISRDLVEAHGGSIDIASEPGRGTEVTVTLPVGSLDRTTAPD